MKKKEISPEEIQVTIAQKLTAILIKLNGKPSMSFKYQQKTDEHVDLVVTWNNPERCKTSKTFLFSELGVSVLDINEVDTYLISLRDVVRSPSHHKIAEYYKKNCNGEIVSESHVKEILEKLKINDVEKNPPTIPEKGNEINPIIIEQVPPTAKENIPKRKRKESKFLLNNFFLHLYAFEEGFDSPVIKLPLPKLLNWEEKEGLQILSCDNEAVASSLETAGRWHVENNFQIGPRITRDGNKIIVNCSHPEAFIKQKKVTTRSFCLAPNEGSTIRDITGRLHRVYFLSEPVVTEMASNFMVKYPKIRLAKSIYEIVLKMGWDVGVEDKSLIIYITPKIPSEVDGKVSVAIAKEFVSSVVTPVVEPVTDIPEEVSPHTTREEFELKIPTIAARENYSVASNNNDSIHLTAETLFVITGTKEEVLAEITNRYHDKEFYDLLSDETKNRAYFVSEEYRKKANAEDYMKALLDYVQKL
jgi:hypothetical protein